MSMEAESNRDKLIDRLRGDLSLVDLEDSYNRAVSRWANDIESRPDSVLKAIKSSKHLSSDQRITTSKIDVVDPFRLLPDQIYYKGLDLLLGNVVGFDDYKKMTSRVQTKTVSVDSPELLLDRLEENRKNSKNTMIAMGHFALFDVGIARGLMLRASESRDSMSSSAVLLNKLMASQKYRGISLMKYFKYTGNVFFSSPKSNSAEKFEVPKKAERMINALFMMDLKKAMGKGGLELYAALTGSQVTSDKEDGQVVRYRMPDIHPSSARLISGFDDLVGITMAKSPSSGHWGMEISDVCDVRKALESNSAEDVVGDLYKGMSKSIENITGIETIPPQLG